MMNGTKSIAIGIDGGGSSTRSIIIDERGRVLGKGKAGPSSYSSVSIDTTRDNIQMAIQQALTETSMIRSKIHTLFIGLGGVLSQDDKQKVKDEVAKLNLCPQTNIYVENDTRNSLAGGLAGEPGLSLIVGTGSVCYGKNQQGSEWKVGGWGHIIDDQGSGYDLGLQAIKAMVRAKDARGLYTPLVDEIFKLLELKELNDIIWKLHQSDFNRDDIAALAPVVLDYARKKDELAVDILQQGVRELAYMVYVVADQLKLSDREVSITMTGGITESGEPFEGMLKNAILERLTKAKIMTPLFSPVVGSALLALEKMGVVTNEELLNNLRKFK